MSSLEHLHAFAKPLGVQLLVENIPNELSTPESLIDLLHAGRFADIGVCFDLGHAHLSVEREGGVRSAEGPHPLHARARQQERSRLASVAGERQHRLEGSHVAAASAPHVPPLLLEIEGVEGEKISEKMAEAFGKLEEA